MIVFVNLVPISRFIFVQWTARQYIVLAPPATMCVLLQLLAPVGVFPIVDFYIAKWAAVAARECQVNVFHLHSPALGGGGGTRTRVRAARGSPSSTCAPRSASAQAPVRRACQLRHALYAGVHTSSQAHTRIRSTAFNIHPPSVHVCAVDCLYL